MAGIAYIGEGDKEETMGEEEVEERDTGTGI